MNHASDLGQSVNVWVTEPAATTLPDMAFVPISEKGVEMNTDYEPVVYQNNRTLMAANAAQELNELQERNHATTAYSTLDCVAMPLFPTFNAQRLANCSVREKELARNRYEGRAPGYGTQGAVDRPVARDALRSASAGAAPTATCSAPTPGAASPRSKKVPPPARSPPASFSRSPPRRLSRAHTPVRAAPTPAAPGFVNKMINSVRGARYDWQHRAVLPPAIQGQGKVEVLKYTLTRDQRGAYLLLWITLLLLVITLICIMIKFLAKN